MDEALREHETSALSPNLGQSRRRSTGSTRRHTFTSQPPLAYYRRQVLFRSLEILNLLMEAPFVESS